MKTSRRSFLRCCLSATGGCAVCQPSCRGTEGGSGTPARAKRPSFEPVYLRSAREGRLRVLDRELWEVFRACRCCPRQCGVNRLKGEKGFCSSTARLKVYSAAPHFGEEAQLVGRGGSGTIFFSNCNLLCCFCQNWQINHRGDGEFIDPQTLADMMLGLQRRGCHNINLVTPTHVVPHIVRAVLTAAAQGLHLPLVFNSGGYDSVEIVKALEDVIDIYLPDFKYQDGTIAAKYSSGASDYPEVAARVIAEMHRQVGELRVDERGVAERGLIIRHLVMPGNIAGTDRFVQWVASTLSRDTFVNLMSQYRPEHRARDYPELARRITREEWLQAVKWAKEAGLRACSSG